MTPTKINLDLDFEKDEYLKFLEKEGLNFDGCDEAYAIRDNGKIVATAAFDGNILKLFAVDESRREEGFIPSLVTYIKDILFKKGIKQTFIYTKPEYENVFTSMFYSVLARTDRIILLTDDIDDYNKWIQSIKELGTFTTAVVMNANPFTKGHRYLMDVVQREVINIIVFVVEEDKSIFGFEDRFKMVKKGLEDIWLEVVPGGKYIISKASFPSYFLKKTDDISKEYAKLDADLFVGRIAKDLGIKIRYVGEEPEDELTNSYNKALIERSKDSDLLIRVVKRLEVDGKPVSASFVRNNLNNKELIKDYLPDSTIEILEEIKRDDRN